MKTFYKIPNVIIYHETKILITLRHDKLDN